MVDIVINGRLGNQLFMYAMARAAQLESSNDSIYINTSIIESENCDNSLKNYQLPDFVRFYSKPVRTLSKGLKLSYLMNLRLINYRKSVFGMTERQKLKYELDNMHKHDKYGFFPCNDLYREMDFKNKKNILLFGYYQSERFFKPYRDIIIKDLVPRYPVMEKNKQKLQDIKSCESVCVSLRLGEDYRKNPMYNVCTPKYFVDAINYMKQKLKNPVFYIFSDVVEGLEDLFEDTSDMVFETGNDPDYEKLRLMSSCKHFILSNSSFSWWTQYLSENENKIVIAPDRWYNGVDTDIMMDNWILLET